MTIAKRVWGSMDLIIRVDLKLEKTFNYINMGFRVLNFVESLDIASRLGLGGIIGLVLLYVFQDIIKNTKRFPPEIAYKIYKSLIQVTGLVAVLGIVSTTISNIIGPASKSTESNLESFQFREPWPQDKNYRVVEDTDKLNDLLRSDFSINFWLLDDSDEPDDLTNYSIFYMVFDIRGDDADTMYWDGIWFYKRKDIKDNGQYSLYFKPKDSTKEHTMVKGGSFTCLKGSTGKGDSIWHNYTITYDQDKEQIRLFQNGRELTSENQSIQGVKMGEYLDSSSQLVIGASPVVREKGYPWKGQWDDFRIYDFTLTKPQMKKIYKKQKPK